MTTEEISFGGQQQKFLIYMISKNAIACSVVAAGRFALKKLGFAIGAALFAQAAVAGTPMWQNIESGMTREQVLALYPNAESKKDKLVLKGVSILPDCPANVEVNIDTGNVVNRILIKGKPAIGASCSNKVREAVLAKYGQPISHDGGQNDYGLSDDEVLWNVQGMKVKFRRDETAAFRGPSWYMEYDAVATQINL